MGSQLKQYEYFTEHEGKSYIHKGNARAHTFDLAASKGDVSPNRPLRSCFFTNLSAPPGGTCAKLRHFGNKTAKVGLGLDREQIY